MSKRQLLDAFKLIPIQTENAFSSAATRTRSSHWWNCRQPSFDRAQNAPYELDKRISGKSTARSAIRSVYKSNVCVSLVPSIFSLSSSSAAILHVQFFRPGCRGIGGDHRLWILEGNFRVRIREEARSPRFLDLCSWISDKKDPKLRFQRKSATPGVFSFLNTYINCANGREKRGTKRNSNICRD